jgi:transcriptional regulator with XRE-family HTH domain
MASPSPGDASVMAVPAGIAVADPTVSFGVLLRLYRHAALLSQEALAEQAGLSARTIRDLEAGRVERPRGATVRLLVQALGLAGSRRRAFEMAASSLSPAPAEPAAGPGDRDHPGGPAGEGEMLAFQLPPAVADFTGRSDLTADLYRWLTTPSRRAESPQAVAVAIVTGRAGVGKTALAVHVGHQLRWAFPDGQLFVTLDGANPQPLDPGEALGRFLRALGMDATQIPDRVQDRAALFRARTARRRVLVVLDDAGGEAQLRPLLPGGSGCGVLVTSRSLLTALEGARLVDLDGFDLRQALELLARIIGRARTAAEPDAATAIVDRCGRLPLAVRIAGARLLAKPHWPLAQLAERLGDERRRLDELAAGDLEVRASVALSYQGLDGLQRRTFRRLGLLETTTFSAWAAAALLGLPVPQAERSLEALTDARLLDVVGRDGIGQVRYRFHDLMRLFARERAAAEEGEADR